MLEVIGHLIFGYFGVGLLLTAALVAAAVFITAVIPPPFGVDLRRYIIEAAIVCAVCTTIFGKGYVDGANFKQAQWDQANVDAIKKDDAARSGAESDVSRGVRDGFDRDKQ